MSLLPLTSIMTVCYKFGAIHVMKPLSTYSTLDLCFRRKIDAGSVMISAIRFLHPSSDPPCVGNGQYRAVEGKAATVGSEGRERDKER